MQKIILFSIFLFSLSALAQEDFLAQQYFNEGDYKKAVVFYEKLVEQNPRRTDYAEGLIDTYQQLERYDDAENFLLKKLEQREAYPTLLVELGYNYTLQKQPQQAQKYYKQAIAVIENNPNFGYSIGLRFQEYVLLDWALMAYTKSMELNPQLDYNYQMARIYGEQGDIEKMYVSYLKLVSEGKTSKSNILRQIDDFITTDPENKNNQLFKQVLLKNAQKSPDLLWNELLSWLFVKQEQYSSAFRQEKALYKRMQAPNMQRLEALGSMTLENSDTETANNVYQFIANNTSDEVTGLNAKLKLIEIQLRTVDDKSLVDISDQFDALVALHGYKNSTLQLQIAYANFLTFKKNLPVPAINILKKVYRYRSMIVLLLL